MKRYLNQVRQAWHNLCAAVNAVKNAEDGAASVQSMILIGVSFIGLIIIIVLFPIVITGITTVTALNLTPYTGLSDIVNLTPLLVWVGAIVMTVVTGYMGVKSMKS